MGLLAIAPAAVKFAETEVAVSDLETHPAGLSERHRLPVVAFGVLGTARCGDVSGQGEGSGLMSSTTALAAPSFHHERRGRRSRGGSDLEKGRSYQALVGEFNWDMQPRRAHGSLLTM